jgi:hypothetical protein
LKLKKNYIAVPSAAPQSISCLALTSQNIQITWLPPPKEFRHGSIQGYKVVYESGSMESSKSIFNFL